ncbi:enoyl-CoA hydratase [Skeletonema marinoi]|uniref:Enoyl-CoA hydratase n=1 Tax=Skeletonema marinoi TaxID=267567 RepID=A0AAD8Y0Q5_9STRA|nr:enoyl-CoA hydratase [Skeletonema marinoi]
MTDSSTTEAAVVLTSRIPLPDSERCALLITLNRPHKKNCFNTEVCHKLAQIFHNVAEEVQGYDSNCNNDDDGSNNNEEGQLLLAAVILTGAGKSFCAGADLSAPPNPLHQSSDLPHHLQWNPVHQMSRVGIPIIGVVRGHVITGGFELALACDILIGSHTTTFRDTHVKFGLAPCWGLSQKLSQRIGPGRAKIVSFSARPLRAERAYEWGLLDELIDETNNSSEVDDDVVLKRAIELSANIASNDPLMVRRYKRAMVEGTSMTLQNGLQRERELGISHYLEIVGDGATFETAKDFISDDKRPRAQSKL